MTFQLLDSTTLVAFVAVALLAGLAGVLALALTATRAITAHRPVRRVRHQSVPAYYGGLLTSH